jgi:hypothetical protein
MAQLSSRDVEASSIYGDYELNASEGSDILKAEATFYAQGSGSGTGIVYVNLDDGADVAFEGHSMRENSNSISNDVHYEAQLNKAANAYSFDFTNKDGGVYSNAVPRPRTFHLRQALPSQVSPDDEIVLAWEGENALSDESLSVDVSLESDDGSSSSAAYFGGAMSGSSGELRIRLSSQGLAGPATAKLTACRTRRGLPSQAPSEGGQWTSTYCLRSHQFKLLYN